MTDHSDTWNRRRLLRTLGSTAALGGLAGCSSLTTDSTTGKTPTETAGETPTATETPTETRTPTPEGGDGSDGDETGDSGDGGTAPSAGACEFGDRELAGDCSGAVELRQSVSSDTVLGENCSHYRVTEEIWVTDGANLTIQPGTKLTFEQGTSLHVREGASLTAEGTCESPILLTGDQPVRGYWNGLVFWGTQNLDNRLRHVTVEYAGGDSANHTVNAAGVELLDARVSFERCTLRENEGDGISLRYDAVVDAFDACRVTANDGAASARSPSAHYFEDSSTYTGNDDDRILVEPTSTGLADDADVTWEAVDARYVVTDELSNYGHLTVAPGATVSFQQDAGIDCIDGGTLTAVGLTYEERTRPITFTGEQKTRGYWRGLRFRDTDRTENVLRYVVVEYGGSNSHHSVEPANVTVRAGSRLRVDNSTLRNARGFGIALGTEEHLDSFTSNTVTGNADGAAWARSPSAHQFSDTSTYTGNDDDKVVVSPTSSGLPERLDVSWESLDARYVVTDILRVEGGLTVEPGATIAFESDAGLRIRSTGSLTAIGLTHDEETRPITFTGEQKTRGYWLGLDFDGTDSVRNRLSYAVVEYGGSEAAHHSTEPANVTVRDGARLQLAYSTLRESAGFGLYNNRSNVTAAAVTYQHNASGQQGSV